MDKSQAAWVRSSLPQNPIEILFLLSSPRLHDLASQDVKLK